MSCKTLILGIFSLILLFKIINGQIPTLDALQTVNSTNGKMQFSLPLTTVNGVNGQAVPITLSYSAGIQYHQQASPAGLGFSYGVGGITRKVIYMPDNNEMGYFQYDKDHPEWSYSHNNTSCEPTLWERLLPVRLFIAAFVALVTSAITFGTASPPAWAVVVTLCATAVDVGKSWIALNQPLVTSNQSYIAGGDHMPSYNRNEGKGYGFFKGGFPIIDSADVYKRGYPYDHPDIYTVNTPFVNGTFTWVGKPEDGHFIFTRNTGSFSKNEVTKKIVYDVDHEKFTIWLEDGTCLYFEKAMIKPNEGSATYVSDHVNGHDCTFNPGFRNPIPMADMWILTKVLSNDYIDGSNPIDNDPLNSQETNKGSWFSFEYDSIVTSHIFRKDLERYQAGYNSTAQIQNGLQVKQAWEANTPEYGPQGPFCVDAVNIPTKEFYLRKIISPNQSAEFIYSDNRQDDMWYRKLLDSILVSGQNWDCNVRGERPVNRSVLNKINLLSRDGNILSTINFNTGYDLRPNSMHSFAAENKSLTLRSLSFTDNLFTNYTVNFDYVALNPDGWGRKRQTTPYEGYNRTNREFICYLEEKDMWGYYCKNTGSENDFNTNQDQSRTAYTDPSDGEIHPYAEAWSLRKVSFPNGKNIEWKYESNRYNAVNGNNTSLKFGGGIRVKQVTESCSNPQNSKHWNFFYTDMETPGSYEENGNNSSGHATISPYAYLTKVDYRIINNTKGGLYTPTEVFYERVIIVPQYNPTPVFGNSKSPIGYNVFDFVTNRESPNGGFYGEVDNSWQRNHLIKKCDYSSKNVLVSKQENYFEYIPSGVQWLNVDDSTGYMRAGTVRLVKTESTEKGIKTINQNFYPDQIEGNKVSGRIPYGRNEIFAGYAKEKDFGKGIGNGLCLIEFPGQSEYSIGMFSFWSTGENLSQPPYTLTHYMPKLHLFKKHTEINKRSYFDSEEEIDLTEFRDPVAEDIGQFMLGGVGVFQLRNSSTPDMVVAYQRPSSTWNMGGPQTTYKKMITIYSDLDESNWEDIELGNFTIGKCAFIDVDNDGVRDLVSFHSDNLVDIATNLMGTVQIRTNLTTTSNVSASSYISGICYDNDHNYNDIVTLGGTTLKSSCMVYRNISLNGTEVSFYREQSYSGPSQYKIDNDSVCGITWLPNVNKPVYMLKEHNHRGICIVGHEDQVGLPFRTSKQKSNGIAIVNEIFRAYDNDVYSIVTTPGLKDKRMFTQICGSKSYSTNSISNLPIGIDRVIGAISTSWMRTVDNQWLPQKNFNWKSAINSDGLPITPFIEFDYNSEVNHNWLFTGSTTRTNRFNSVNETVNNASVHNVSVLGHGGIYSIGSVSNAKFTECGIFTGDYDNNEDGFFDKENGWRRGAFNENSSLPSNSAESRVCEEAKHFGKKGIKVTNAFGPSRVFKLEKGMDYILSAWIKVQNGTVPLREGMVMGLDYRRASSPDDVWPIEVYPATQQNTLSCSGVATSKTYSNWNYVEMKIPASTDISNANWDNGFQYASLWVGVPNGSGNGQSATIYIDDIRFYPTNAFVGTIYYDTYSMLPILTVDANNNPGNEVVYDGFGIPIETWRLNKTNMDSPKKLSQKEYHFMNTVTTNGAIKLLSPNGGEELMATHPVKISWWNKKLGDVSVFYRNRNETNDRLIKTVTRTSGYCTIEWIVPLSIGGQYEFKVVNSNGNESDVSDAFVTIDDNPVKIPTNGINRFVSSNNVNLIWQGDVNSARYDIFIGTGGNAPALVGSTTTPSYDVIFTRDQNYTWYVRAVNTYGSRQSANWTFTTTSRQFIVKYKYDVSSTIDNGNPPVTRYIIGDKQDTFNYFPGENVNFTTNCKVFSEVGGYGGSYQTGIVFANWALENGDIVLQYQLPNPRASFIMQNNNVSVQANYTTSSSLGTYLCN
jgi:hypothetical protein